MHSDYAAADGSTTKHRRSARRALQNWLLPMFTWLPRELLRVRLLRFLVCAVRYLWFVVVLRRLRTTAGTEGVARTTVAHNLRGMLDLHVERSLRLIWPLAAQAAGDRIDLRDQKVLSVGPRTEGEIINLVAHGWRLRNITGLDLITYSPRIHLGDMHAMPFADATFDVAIAGWVIGYSERKDIAAAEIARVVKPGGLVAVGIEWTRKTPQQIAAERTGYIVGSADLLLTADAILALFGDRIDRVYYRQDDRDISGHQDGDLLVVFRLR